MDPVDQDERLDRALKGLPAPRAPRSLLPRVLAATVERPAPVATGWSTWPIALRVAASVVFLALVALASMFVAAPPARVSQAADTAGDVATVVRALWDVMIQPVATYLVVLGISLALACALAWAAFEAALGGASHR